MVDSPGGSSLHYGNPWADPESARDPVRKLRGRIPAGVTVWTAGDPVGDWAGLTVSSLMVAQGEPARVAGLIGPDSDFSDVLTATGVFVVHVLNDQHRRLAQHFAGILPAPEDQVVVGESAYGPLLQVAEDRLMCRLEEQRPLGWSLLVDGVVESSSLGEPGAGLAWFRGAFHRL